MVGELIFSTLERVKTSPSCSRLAVVLLFVRRRCLSNKQQQQQHRGPCGWTAGSARCGAGGATCSRSDVQICARLFTLFIRVVTLIAGCSYHVIVLHFAYSLEIIIRVPWLRHSLLRSMFLLSAESTRRLRRRCRWASLQASPASTRPTHTKNQTARSATCASCDFRAGLGVGSGAIG